MGARHRWGIAATGRIAAKFAADLALLDDAELVAVASRTAARAQEFGEQFGVPRRYDSYAALADDPEVDIVYVPTPQTHHHADTVRFLEAGKHVLCEKPFAVNAIQAEAMIDAARRNDRFLMEAVWSRFLPAYERLREVLGSGCIGTPLLCDADIGHPIPVDPTHRLYDHSLAGGVLIDMGIYSLQLATMVLGPAASVVSVGHIGTTGVDESVVAVVTHTKGGHSVAKASIRTTMSGRARIGGTAGWIELPRSFYCPQSLTVAVGDDVEEIDAAFEGNGLRFQAAAVQRQVEEGAVESPLMSWAETLRLARLMDEIRSQIGLRYQADDDPFAAP